MRTIPSILVSATFIFFFGFMQSCAQKKEPYVREYYAKFPDRVQIVQQFYAASPVAFDYPASLVRFEKHKDGWYVARYDGIDFKKPLEKGLVWSAKEQKFLMSGGPLNEQQQQRLQSRFNVPDARYFDQCPLFGYANSASDLIKLLENEQLTDEELECLARAYSRKASNIIFPNQFGADFQAYDTTFQKNAYTQEEVKSFIELIEKSVASYERLQKQNPEYPTPVGSPATKAWNEYLSGYLYLKIIQQDESAKQLLKDDLYDNFTIETVKNILRSVPKEGILFTWGDNDTYPLIYVQDKLQFRQDVSVINLSLANTGRYINYVLNLAPAKVKTSLSLDEYKLAKSEAFIAQRSKDTTDFQQFLNDFAKKPSKYQQTQQGMLINQLPSFYLTLNKAANFTIQLQSPYLTKGNFFLLDVIGANIGKRAIHLSAGIPTTNYPHLRRHLELYGINQSIVAEKGRIGRANSEATHQLIENELKFPIPTQQELRQTEYKTMVAQHVNMFFTYANHIYRQQNLDSLGLVLDLAHAKIPVDKYNYDRFHIPFFSLCMKTERYEQARLHLQTYSKSLVETAKRLQEDKRLSADEKENILRGIKNEMGTINNAIRNEKMDPIRLEIENRLSPYLIQ